MEGFGVGDFSLFSRFERGCATLAKLGILGVVSVAFWTLHVHV
jgi:hypothetical protein